MQLLHFFVSFVNLLLCRIVPVSVALAPSSPIIKGARSSHRLLFGTTRTKIHRRAATSSQQDTGNGHDGNILDEILNVAITASKKAGKIIKRNSDGAAVVDKKSTSRDLLTIVDPQCEQVRDLW